MSLLVEYLLWACGFAAGALLWYGMTWRRWRDWAFERWYELMRVYGDLL